MLVKPVDHLPRDLGEVRPFLNCQGEFEVCGTRVRDPHEYTPKDHVYTSVKHE